MVSIEAESALLEDLSATSAGPVTYIYIYMLHSAPRLRSKNDVAHVKADFFPLSLPLISGT
jgi:hypothetical protein